MMVPSHHLSRSQLYDIVCRLRDKIEIHQRKKRKRDEKRKGRKKEYLYFPSININGRCFLCVLKPFHTIVSEGAVMSHIYNNHLRELNGQYERKSPNLDVQKSLL